MAIRLASIKLFVSIIKSTWRSEPRLIKCPENELYKHIRITSTYFLCCEVIWSSFSLSASNGNATPNVAAKGETLLIWSNWNLFIIYRAWNGALSGYFKTFGIVWFNKRPISPSNCWIRFSQLLHRSLFLAIVSTLWGIALRLWLSHHRSCQEKPLVLLPQNDCYFLPNPIWNILDFSAALGQKK